MSGESKPDLDLWRDRAEEARAQAEQMTDPETRRMMLQIAETYKRMDRARGRHRGGKKQGSLPLSG